MGYELVKFDVVFTVHEDSGLDDELMQSLKRATEYHTEIWLRLQNIPTRFGVEVV